MVYNMKHRGQLIDAAKHQLCEDGRAYHNLDHMYDVNMASRNILDTDGLEEDLWLAILWHDVIYIPGFQQNEEASAAHLEWTMRRLGVLDTQNELSVALKSAQSLILATKVSNHLSHTFTHDNERAYVLMDADLVSLASPDYESFVVYQKNIITEFGFNVNLPESRKSSADFLAKFLDKPSIYHTEYARKHWEAKARKNIVAWSLDATLYADWFKRSNPQLKDSDATPIS